MTKPAASPKQIALIAKLRTEKIVPESWDHCFTAVENNTATWRQVRSLIDGLFALPSKPLAESEKATPGYYSRGEEFFLVVENKAKTGTYAKRLVWEPNTKPSWEYAPGVGRTLAGLTPLTFAEAARIGKVTGYCVRGFEKLDNPVSVAMGYGEICAGHEGWPYPKTAAEKRAVVEAA